MSGKRLEVLLAVTVWFLLLLSNAAADHPKVGLQVSVAAISGKTMGTQYLVKFQDRNRSGFLIDSVVLKEKIQKRLAEINDSMSTYREDSEISQFNRQTHSEGFRVSSDFRQVVQKSIEIHALTRGKFDITVGPLVRFWGFSGGTLPRKMPTPDAVQSVLNTIGTAKLKCNQQGLQKLTPNLKLDVSAIAKGFAVDEIAALVVSETPNFMVEIGGEIFAAGINPSTNRPWTIGIERPAASPGDFTPKVAARVELSGHALATSGDYRNIVVIEGERFQHTIDPTTGYPVSNGIRSVSVIAKDCMTADGLATGLMAHALEAIQSISQSNDLAVLVLFETTPGKIDSWSSPSFNAQGRIQDAENTSAGTKVSSPPNPLYRVLGTIIVFGLAISGMAIGVILSNRQIKGTCGGLSSMPGNENSDASPCDLCTKPASECSQKDNADTFRE
ncbi:MAG: FAD:protein FMN transferase [Planctomycetota bacterium]|nr:FAD:protein FMN transferase [Planctomycetota bacterium]